MEGRSAGSGLLLPGVSQPLCKSLSVRGMGQGKSKAMDNSHICFVRIPPIIRLLHYLSLSHLPDSSP